MTWDEYEALAKKMTSGEGSEKVYGSHNHTWQALVANWAVQDGKNTLMSEDLSLIHIFRWARWAFTGCAARWEPS